MKIRTDPRTGMKYADYMLGGKRRRVSLGTKNNEIAIIKAGKIISDADSKNTASPLFAVFWEKYLAHAKATMRPRSVVNLTQLKKKIDAYGAPKTLDDITPAYVDSLKIYLVNEGMGRASVNTLIGYLKAMVSQADLWGLTNISLRKVKALKTNSERVEFHSNDEIKEILRIAPSFSWEVLVHLDARTGLRKAELLRLKRQDISFYEGGADIYVSGQAKSHKFRIVPVRDSSLIAKLKKLLNQQKRSEFVFSELVGVDISAKYIKWASQSGLHCFLHKLRHTFASQLAQKDVPLQKIQKLLGHANIQTTMKYAHLLPSDLGGAVERLEDI